MFSFRCGWCGFHQKTIYNGTLMRTRWLTMFVTRRLATTYFLGYPTFNMWHHCGCCLCRLFFFKHNILTQDSNVQMGKWSKHLETVRLTRSFELVFWSMSICVHINVGVCPISPIIVYCVNPHFCWSNSDSGLRLPIIRALIALFCFFQGDTWGKFSDVPPAPVAGETESSSPRWSKMGANQNWTPRTSSVVWIWQWWLTSGFGWIWGYLGYTLFFGQLHIGSTAQHP